MIEFAVKRTLFSATHTDGIVFRVQIASVQTNLCTDRFGRFQDRQIKLSAFMNAESDATHWQNEQANRNESHLQSARHLWEVLLKL